MLEVFSTRHSREKGYFRTHERWSARNHRVFVRSCDRVRCAVWNFAPQRGGAGRPVTSAKGYQSFRLLPQVMGMLDLN